MNDMTPFTQPFYNSGAWKDCRAEYRKSVGGLCEECKKNGIITVGDEVHHKIPLTPQNIKDPNITLNWANLELLCKDCHKKKRKTTRLRRWKCGPDGRVEIPPCP